MVARHLSKQGLAVLNYINDFGGVATSTAIATAHFTKLWATLRHLGLTEAEHKTSPPSQDMLWLGLRFNTLDMTITMPESKMMEIHNVMAAWGKKTEANIHELHTLLGKLFFMAQ